jgi:hypothetical protein
MCVSKVWSQDVVLNAIWDDMARLPAPHLVNAIADGARGSEIPVGSRGFFTPHRLVQGGPTVISAAMIATRGTYKGEGCALPTRVLQDDLDRLVVADHIERTHNRGEKQQCTFNPK